ncbi:hypothetical protein BJY04DRAFT_216452 [Aspergillus karnatakaensis]|uniref:zinc finger MYND domain-containing protein n=1 Tax=Aspergillus karnatakaensis TaxID=1810916 RepID=UPI003CCCCEFC
METARMLKTRPDSRLYEVPSCPDAGVALPDVAPPEPVRPRVFTGEIINSGPSQYFFTEIEAKDLGGRLIRIGFTFSNPNDSPDRVPLKILKRGCTILILTAKRCHMPGGGEDGIIVHTPRLVKVLPFRITDFKHFNDKIAFYNEVERGHRRCCGCNRFIWTTHPCSRCRLVHFCSRNCQDIVYGDHRFDCRILRDPDMALLFRTRWDELQEFGNNALKAGVSYIDGNWIA